MGDTTSPLYMILGSRSSLRAQPLAMAMFMTGRTVSLSQTFSVT
jgi:hypothetical protein